MKVVVGMSGGVDSSVTAALLKEQGHDVLGVYMQNWSDDRHLHGCGSWEADRRDALKVATKLSIPFRVVNFEKEYTENVVDYMVAEYAVGRTPNPDMLCNREIKFGMLLRWALEHGYKFVATGHYARVEHPEGKRAQGQSSGTNTFSQLYRGTDRTKDQSYFLSQLSQEQLQHALFPLGSLLKEDVRKEAERRGLTVADKPDSQGLCFVGDLNLAELLKEKIPVRQGEVVTPDGTVVGTHEGAALYTVGQRRGVGVSKPVPMYVLKTDVSSNTVTVGYDRELFTTEVATEPAHWLSGSAEPSGRYDVMIRYRMQPAAAEVTVSEEGLEIRFNDDQRGVTPGQFAALYRGEELVGSAVIR